MRRLAHMVSVWTTVVITIDRYIAVCLPGEVQLRTVRRVKMAVAYVTVLALVCCLPLKVKGQGHDSCMSVSDVQAYNSETGSHRSHVLLALLFEIKRSKVKDKRLLSAALLRLEKGERAQPSAVRRQKSQVGDSEPGAGGWVVVAGRPSDRL